MRALSSQSAKTAYRRPWYLRLLGLESKKSVVSDGTFAMMQSCASRFTSTDPQLRALVLRHNRSPMYAWFQTTVLHVWLCLGRMYEPALDARELMSQEMSDHFFGEVERQLVAHGVTNPLAFNREYRRLAQIFHGTCVAYDKAYIAKDDEQLGRALWRNLLNEDQEQFAQRTPAADEDVSALISYVKKQKVTLKFCDPKKFCEGNVPFITLEDCNKSAETKT